MLFRTYNKVQAHEVVFEYAFAAVEVRLLNGLQSNLILIFRPLLTAGSGRTLTRRCGFDIILIDCEQVAMTVLICAL